MGREMKDPGWSWIQIAKLAAERKRSGEIYGTRNEGSQVDLAADRLQWRSSVSALRTHVKD